MIEKLAGDTHLKNERKEGRVKGHEDEVVDEDAEAGVTAEYLEPPHPGQRSDADQQDLDEGVPGYRGPQERHTPGHVGPHLVLISRVQCQLG